MEEPAGTPFDAVRVSVDGLEGRAVRRNSGELPGGRRCRGRDEVGPWRTSRASWAWEGTIGDSISVYVVLEIHGAEYQANFHVPNSSVESVGVRDLAFDPSSDAWTGLARVFAYARTGEPCVEREDLPVRFPRRGTPRRRDGPTTGR